MKPKKPLIARAQANGSIDRLNQLLSASHILLCEANGLLEEAADRYFNEFASMIETEKQKMDMFEDMDGFDAYFRRWSKLPKEWTPEEGKRI